MTESHSQVLRFIPKEAMYYSHKDYYLLHGLRALGELPKYDQHMRGWFVDEKLVAAVENFRQENNPRES